ncbi:MAG TPA: hypothetical protein VHX63_07450 [Acidobacteriaceae bacterium]|jgi:hypothetical protein|nr:hypothetical protein [Acidobacteriaceae bacterium]
MNNPVPNYLTPYVLSGVLAVVAAVIFGLHKALQLAGWPAQARRRAVSSGALLLLGWLFAALLTSWLGLYHGVSSKIPMIQYGLLLPIVVGVALFWLSSSLRRVVDAVPQEWIASVQLYRAEGLIFLVLYAGGHLPGAFAWPAGVGDVLVGLLAPVVGIAHARSPRHAAGWLRAWNLFGIADLIVAVTTGFLTSPSRFQMFSLNAPNQLITAFPLAMIPVFLVPLSILLHLASLKKLRQTKNAWQIPDPVAAGVRT